MREQNFLIRGRGLKGLILAVTALTMSFSVAAQEGSINLPARTLTSKELFEAIQQQTRYHVAANSMQTQALSVNISRSPITVKSALDRLLSGSGLSHQTDGNFILITQVPVQNDSQVAINSVRNLYGTVTDKSGALLEGVRVEMVDTPGKRATTFANGRFCIEDVPPGNRIIKLSSADGATIRYSEVNIPTGSDADLTLVLSEQLLTSTNHTAQAHESQPAKSTAFFVPNSKDHTVRAFSDEPKTEYSFVPSAKVREKHLPRAAVKTNLLYLATTTLNIGGEFGLARKWTFDITAGINTWDLNGDKGGIRHWLVQPEARYWFCNRFERHFVGLHAMGGQYQIQNIDLSPFGNDLTDKRYDGWGIGGGVSYGYHLPMGKRWGWEFTAGIGYIYLKYDKYNCGECENLIGKKSKHYFGPTKIGISLLYMIK